MVGADDPQSLVLSDFKDYLSGKRYLYHIDAAVAKKLPVCKPAEGMIPLDIAESVSLAYDYLKSKINVVHHIELKEIALSRQTYALRKAPELSDRLWAYIVVFEVGLDEQESTHYEQVFVLLNGQVIVPEVSSL